MTSLTVFYTNNCYSVVVVT